MATPVKFSTVKVVLKEKRFIERLMQPGESFTDTKYVKGKYRKGSVTIIPINLSAKAKEEAKAKAEAKAEVEAKAGKGKDKVNLT